jgi:hypothetical protein
MVYLIKDSVGAAVDFAPASVIEEVIQNVRTILATIKFSVPMDREFGVDGAIIDRPINLAKARLSSEIFRAVRRYEPRAVIESIEFEGAESGRLSPIVKVSIRA